MSFLNSQQPVELRENILQNLPNKLLKHIADSASELILLKHEFRCESGLCLQKTVACNGKRECDDGSDETIGCSQLFPEESCASWFGEKHVRCTEFNNTLDSRVRSLYTVYTK